MLYVCDRCGAWLDPPCVERDEAVCDACGLRTPFVRLPLYQFTGASGTGKSAVAARLEAQVPDHVALGRTCSGAAPTTRRGSSPTDGAGCGSR